MGTTLGFEIYFDLTKAKSKNEEFAEPGDHNFAWQECYLVNGREREIIVHRQGATPGGYPFRR